MARTTRMFSTRLMSPRVRKSSWGTRICTQPSGFCSPVVRFVSFSSMKSFRVKSAWRTEGLDRDVLLSAMSYLFYAMEDCRWNNKNNEKVKIRRSRRCSVIQPINASEDGSISGNTSMNCDHFVAQRLNFSRGNSRANAPRQSGELARLLASSVLWMRVVPHGDP